jgi:hypothetical protein
MPQAFSYSCGCAATAPVFDPEAKLGVRGGDKALRDLVAVELFAVAPESLKA